MRTTLMKLMLLGFLTFGPVMLLPARAVEPDEVLADPKLEARARELSHELRCLVCQNQSIDDSNAPLARDLRLLVRERLQAGDSDAAVKSFLVARYGDFVLLKPPFDRSTLVLWGTPAVLLLLTIGVLLARLGGRGHGLDARQPPPLTADEQKKLDRLLDDAR